jgi:hypothetical protein
VSDGLSGPNWFPQPPPKPLKASSGATLVFGSVVSAVVVGVIVWMSVGHSGQEAKSVPGAPAALTVTEAAQGSRQAFAECMQSMGADSGVRGRGRFGGGAPSKNYRSALDVCRSLLHPGQPRPIAPPRTGTTPAPVA